MSRKGKSPLKLPEKVQYDLQGSLFTAQGAKGKTQVNLPGSFELKTVDGALFLHPLDPASEGAKHGLAWALVSNAIQGCSQGFSKKLELVGVGFRADVQGDQLDLQLGFSHPTKLKIPEGVTVRVEKGTAIFVEGSDLKAVSQFAADTRSLKKPEPYKGKGIRYSDEYVRRKAGKASKK